MISGMEKIKKEESVKPKYNWERIADKIEKEELKFEIKRQKEDAEHLKEVMIIYNRDGLIGEPSGNNRRNLKRIEISKIRKYKV